MYKKILHGLDGSEGSFRALVDAIHLAKCCSAELHTISVEELPRYPGAVGEILEEKMTANGKYTDAIEKARQIGQRYGTALESHVVIGHEVKTIIEFIKQKKIDLLVIGFMGHSAIYDRVMGSTCQSLVRLSPCAVLVVK